MSHSPVVGRGGACVMCGWPVKAVRNARGFRDFVHLAPAPRKEATDATK